MIERCFLFLASASLICLWLNEMWVFKRVLWVKERAWDHIRWGREGERERGSSLVCVHWSECEWKREIPTLVISSRWGEVRESAGEWYELIPEKRWFFDYESIHTYSFLHFFYISWWWMNEWMDQMWFKHNQMPLITVFLSFGSPDVNHVSDDWEKEEENPFSTFLLLL